MLWAESFALYFTLPKVKWKSIGHGIISLMGTKSLAKGQKPSVDIECLPSLRLRDAPSSCIQMWLKDLLRGSLLRMGLAEEHVWFSIDHPTISKSSFPLPLLFSYKYVHLVVCGQSFGWAASGIYYSLCSNLESRISKFREIETPEQHHSKPIKIPSK